MKIIAFRNDGQSVELEVWLHPARTPEGLNSGPACEANFWTDHPVDDTITWAEVPVEVYVKSGARYPWACGGLLKRTIPSGNGSNSLLGEMLTRQRNVEKMLRAAQEIKEG